MCAEPSPSPGNERLMPLAGKRIQHGDTGPKKQRVRIRSVSYRKVRNRRAAQTRIDHG